MPPDGLCKALLNGFQERAALVGREDAGVFKSLHLAQEKLLPVFLIQEIIAFHFVELQAQLHKISAVDALQRGHLVHHVFNVLLELPPLLPFEIHKGQVFFLVVELIFEVKQHDLVKFIETAFAVLYICAMLLMPVLACLYQLPEPFQEHDAIDILFIIQQGFAAMLNKALVVGTGFYLIKHKIIGLLLYDVFFQGGGVER